MIDSVINMDSSTSQSYSRGVKRYMQIDREDVKAKKWKKNHKRSKHRGCPLRQGIKFKVKNKKNIRTIHPEAPFNSTQFLMDEHDKLDASQLCTYKQKRHRDSSFSMESEDPDYYESLLSSSEEEENEQYLTKEFWHAYDDVHAEQLDSMPKTQLLQEFLSLEDRLISLERELHYYREQDQIRTRESSPVDDEEEEEMPPGEIRVDPETAAKIEVFTSEIAKLEEENKSLKMENRQLSMNMRCKQYSSSSDSDSSGKVYSSSSSGESDSDSSASDSEIECEENIKVCERLNQKQEKSLSTFCASDSGVASCEASSSSGVEDCEKLENKPKIIVPKNKEELRTIISES